MLNNFELKFTVDRDQKTKEKYPKMRYSYNTSDIRSALNSTFMKMEHSLTAPRDGTVESDSAELGAQVPEGQILVALEEA